MGFIDRFLTVLDIAQTVDRDRLGRDAAYRMAVAQALGARPETPDITPGAPANDDTRRPFDETPGERAGGDREAVEQEAA